MVKQFILLIQLIGVFFYQLVLTGDVTVSQSIPETIQAGKEVVVEITVNKSDASGFAKVQQDIPAGFSVEYVDTKGATFSFKDNRIKFIWMALPTEEEFTISYKLKPNSGTKGDFVIGGKFSFIADSERKNIVIPENKFKVTEDVLASNENEEINPENEEIETVSDEVQVNISRSIQAQDDGSYNVILSINKNNVSGFAKLSEKIPAGFIASEIQNGGGVFSYKEGVAKILWMAIPNSDQFNVSYSIKPTTASNKEYSISGEFAYLENDITQKKQINSTTFSYNNAPLAENTENQETSTNEEVIEETSNNQESSEEIVAEETSSNEESNEEIVAEETFNNEEVENSNNENEVTSIPAPETSVSYKVQVGAGHKTVPGNYFAVKFNLKDNVSTENHEGWIKYLVGSFNEYKAARDKRNIVRNNVKTAFVTAYNSGKRITVQEALMISNQKWYK